MHTCPAGKHDMSVARNVYVQPDGRRRCQGCRREWQRGYNRRMREALRLVENIRTS